jgi:predicted molibdopterin-dependent oxidoreductase YjgC
LPRIEDHPVLGPRALRTQVTITVDGRPFCAEEGEPIAAALWAAGLRLLRWSPKRGEPRGVFCAIGRCTDCVMTVDGQPNVRTCVTPVRDGMVITRQRPGEDAHGR